MSKVILPRGRTRDPEGDTPLRSGRPSPYSDVLQFMRLLRAVEHQVRQISKRMRPSLGVTGSELLVLRMVARHPGLSAGELARLLHLNASTLTGVLDRLAQRKLLERGTDEHDRRRDVLQVTAAGRRVDKLRTGTVEAHFQRALSKLSLEEIRVTAGALRTLAAELARR